MTLMKNTKFVLYIGANDGTICLPLAEKNKDLFIHAFEPNPALVKKIKLLKKKIEKSKNISINNFKIHQLAVGDKDKSVILNISKHDKVSSTKKLSKHLDKAWPGYRKSVFKVVKKKKVKMITLSNFIKKNSISKILYIHIDTQGNDLNVLKGLKKYIHKVESGKMEAAINIKKAAYENAGILLKVKKFLLNYNFTIEKIVKIERVFDNEVDIFFFKKKPFYKKIFKSINSRYYIRLLEDKLYSKDIFFDFIIKNKNKVIKKFF
jgi:FkbM family methyltransferase